MCRQATPWWSRRTDREGIEVAAGIGVGATDEPHEFDGASTLLPAEDELTARVREAIRDDGATTAYADFLEISTDGRTVWLRGVGRGHR